MQINKERNHSTYCKHKHKGALLKKRSIVSLNSSRLTTIKRRKNKTNENLKDKFIKNGKITYLEYAKVGKMAD